MFFCLTICLPKEGRDPGMAFLTSLFLMDFHSRIPFPSAKPQQISAPWLSFCEEGGATGKAPSRGASIHLGSVAQPSPPLSGTLKPSFWCQCREVDAQNRLWLSLLTDQCHEVLFKDRRAWPWSKGG